MKTPREILLKQHQSVEPKLKRMWHEKLAPELVGDTASVGHNVLVAVGWKMWRELIWPSRRIWAGLACAWLLIIGLNVASSEPAPRVVGKTQPRSGDEIRALIEQRRMLAQLIDPLPEPTRKRKSGAPGPRSDRATETITA